jgi:hypothetical protein
MSGAMKEMFGKFGPFCHGHCWSKQYFAWLHGESDRSHYHEEKVQRHMATMMKNWNFFCKDTNDSTVNETQIVMQICHLGER